MFDPKNGSLRFYVNQRKLNADTSKHAHPLPKMNECIDSLGEARIFSTVDASSGYWQIKNDKHNCKIATLTSHHGLYEFIRMPFGLKIAPNTLQRAMDMIISKLKWPLAFVHFQDKIVFLSDLLSDARVLLKLRQCFFFYDETNHPGHVMKPGELFISNKANHAICGLEQRTNET